MKRIFLLLTFFALVFNGCLDYYQETEFNKDGAGKMFIEYSMKKKPSMIDTNLTTAQNDSVIATKIIYFNKDSVKNLYTSPIVNNLDVKVFSKASDSTLHAQISFKYQDINKLVEVKTLAQFQFSYSDGAEGQKIYKQFVPPMSFGFGGVDTNLRATFVCYLPGEIITHNASELKRNKLTWSFKQSEIGSGKTLTATIKPFKLNETPKWLYYVLASVLLIVLFFLIKRGRS